MSLSVAAARHSHCCRPPCFPTAILKRRESIEAEPSLSKPVFKVFAGEIRVASGCQTVPAPDCLNRKVRSPGDMPGWPLQTSTRPWCGVDVGTPGPVAFPQKHALQ